MVHKIDRYKMIILLLLITFITVYSENRTLPNIVKITLASEVWQDATNEDGTGFYWDLTRLVFGKSNIKVIHRTFPYSRAVSLTKKGFADGWIGSYINEQEFAIYPYYNIDYDDVHGLCIKGKIEGDTLTFLKNKRVSWIQGYNYDKYIDIPMQKHPIINRVSGINMLVTDRIDVILDAKLDIEIAIKNSDFHASKFTIFKVQDLKTYIAFTNSKKGRELAKIWDSNIKILVESGELKKFYEKYNYTAYPF